MDPRGALFLWWLGTTELGGLFKVAGNTNTYQQNTDLPRNLVTQRISKRCGTNHSRERTQTILGSKNLYHKNAQLLTVRGRNK